MTAAPIAADVLIDNIGQLVSAPGQGALRGSAQANITVTADAALAIRAGVIVAAGPADALAPRVRAQTRIDAEGRAVCPGLIDCHTHLVYAGDRVGEFEQRLQGARYIDILAAGGGILHTMRQTRAASVEALVAQARPRLLALRESGVTTVEVKTGYGLDRASEVAMFEAIAALDALDLCDVIPTALPAHATPPEFRAERERYVEAVIDDILPALAEAHARSRFAARGRALGVDAFCEREAFSVEQSRRVLAAGRRLGMIPTLHTDQFYALGGIEMALALGARSCDHLEAAAPEDRARLGASASIAVVLPACAFNFGNTAFADARGLLAAGAAVAIATDHNPGSSPCLSLPLAMAIACRYQRLTPAEALNAATVNAAAALGLSDRGRLMAGQRADLIMLHASDWRHLVYGFGGNPVARVMRAGRFV